MGKGIPGPQKENGFTPIANEIMEALVRFHIPGSEMRCLLFILRKTYGYHKKTDAISLSQFERATGIDRKSICRALNGLADKNIVLIKKGGGKFATTSISKYRFNKHFNTWRNSVKKATGSGKTVTQVVAKKPHTKDIITKDREIYTYLSRQLCDFVLGFVKFISKNKGNLAPKSKNLVKDSAEAVDKLIRLDGFDLEYITEVVRWAVKDDFWANNVLSLVGLRRKNKEGITKFQNIANKYESGKKKQGRSYTGPNGSGRSEENAQVCQDFINEMMQECENE